MAVVYRLYSKNTHKAYIGSSKLASKRFREHRCLLRKGEHECKSLQELWDANGEDDFAIKTLKCLSDHSTTKDKRHWEEYFMEVYDEMGLLLNTHKNAYQPSPETQAKASKAGAKARTGKPAHTAQREKMRKLWADPEWAAETVRKREVARLKNKRKLSA